MLGVSRIARTVRTECFEPCFGLYDPHIMALAIELDGGKETPETSTYDKNPNA